MFRKILSFLFGGASVDNSNLGMLTVAGSSPERTDFIEQPIRDFRESILTVNEEVKTKAKIQKAKDEFAHASGAYTRSYGSFMCTGVARPSNFKDLDLDLNLSIGGGR